MIAIPMLAVTWDGSPLMKTRPAQRRLYVSNYTARLPLVVYGTSNDKLVAADACRSIGSWHGTGQAGADLTQDIVADFVAPGVVYVLEVVQIEV